MIFQQARIFENIDLHVAVRPEADSGAGWEQTIGGNSAVAKIPLGTGTRTDSRFGFAQGSRFLICDVNRMDAGEVRIDDSVCLQQVDRTLAVFANASFHFGGLFGYMHMKRQMIRTGVADHFEKIVERDSPDAVRRNTNPRFARL